MNAKMLLKKNARLLNPRKTSHSDLEQQRQAALAEVERYNDNYGNRWLARVEEAIQRRAAGHYEYLLSVAAHRREQGYAGAEYFEGRAAEVARGLASAEKALLKGVMRDVETFKQAAIRAAQTA